MELECAVQKYAWGVPGMKSSVAQLAKAATPEFEVSEEETFAELWMGTHPNGPSVIKGTGEVLGHYIRRHPGVLGTPVIQTFGEQLPFLFKVLSVNQALSIQAHPNKSHAEELHQQRPEVYKDPNHKPEMTIALTPFQALCGFRPAHEIVKHLRELPELQQVVGEDNANTFIEEPTEGNLKECFSAMMNAPKEKIESALNDLITRFSEMDAAKGSELLQDLFMTLHDKYPGDVGCFSIYLLNYLTLQPGQAMFLGPNVIHAYLFGDCIECMACSDNVVRAGLTPKYQDVETLVSMLEYNMVPAESRNFEGFKMDNYTILYNPPVLDFAVDMIEVPSGVEQYTLRPVESASIVLVVEGNTSKVEVNPPAPGEVPQVTSLQRGSVIFLAADQSLTLKPNSGSRLLAFRALCVL
ncbi:mannose-6-phosphate isomerase-like [Eriocheir sinensis]|uniref:mannose-6-phosphate isomerase-like n=1 Tax=Eriocheir sinensis TaxID=95602 RepID=UPI0021C8543B|nr:mannose-6-phosphate isomerase-like [Eriocheir sinensis]XP_050720002.1 mannose-6-phosphate isomerase-like [Eriocheir sinensis]XP_050720010.1 mannose-6-phosphate isomerase-like [Eriocheir sinensis]